MLHQPAAPPQPLTVATNWGNAGAASFAVLLALVAVAAIFYVHALRRRKPLPLRMLVLTSAAGLAAAFCSPVLFSSDVYAYAAYGEMARIGLNPYAHASAGASDILIRAAAWQWVTAFPICVYGPAFVALARLLVTGLAPFGVLAQLDAFRIAACAALLLCIPLAYGAFPGNRAARLCAAATIGLNPTAIWCAAEGHNDALALAVVLAGFVLVQRRFAAWGAALVGLSASIKLPGLAAALALAAVERRCRAGAAVGIAIATALSLPLAAGVATQLAPGGRYAPQASLQAVFAPLGPIAAPVVAAAVAALLATCGIRLLRSQLAEGWIWLGLAAWVLIPNPYPWYALWLVAPAALAPQSRAGRVAILLSFTALLRYLPDAAGTPGPAVSVAIGIAATLPVLALTPWRPWYNERLA
jgi:hypothetical protein